MTAGQRPEGAKIASYPLFAPPEDLATKPTSSWSPSEVKRYKEWLLGSMPARINTLKSTLDLHPFGSPESTLVDAGRKLVALLSEPDASRPGRRETATLRGHEISYETGPLLTVHSYAIAADVGLLMAEMLTDRYDLHWDVVRRRKDAVAYNLPACSGSSQAYTWSQSGFRQPWEMASWVARRARRLGSMPIAGGQIMRRLGVPDGGHLCSCERRMNSRIRPTTRGTDAG